MADPKPTRRHTWWGDLPGWLQVVIGVILVLIALSGIHAATSGPTSGSTHKLKQRTQPLGEIFLEKAPHANVTAANSGSLGSGLARIGGAIFQHSVRQLYDLSCCSDTQSVTYTIPEGYHRFRASIGIETGGTYNAEHTAGVTFEVDLGGTSDRAYINKMSYGEGAADVNLDVSGQSAIVLQTVTDSTNCFTCEADAVWGEARLTP